MSASTATFFLWTSLHFRDIFWYVLYMSLHVSVEVIQQFTNQNTVLLYLNWWKRKPSGSIACSRKQQPRFYWSYYLTSFYQLGGHIGRNGTIAQPHAARGFNAGHDYAKTRWRRIWTTVVLVKALSHKPVWICSVAVRTLQTVLYRLTL